MGNFLFFILIFFLLVYVRKTPPGKIAVIKRSGKYLKTVNPNTSYFFNPKTDSVTLIDIKPKAFSDIILLSSRDRIYYNVKIKFTYYVIDPLKIVDTQNFSNTFIKSQTILILKSYFSKRPSKELSTMANVQTLKIHDLLNSNLNTFGISIKNMNLQIKFSEDETIKNKTSNFEKVPCIHTNDNYTIDAQENNYSTNRNDVDEITVFDGGAIKNYDLASFRTNPIKESLSFKNAHLYTLENEDSNIDPIKNL